MNQEKGRLRMERYVKPVVLVNEDFAEGVYAASGSVFSGTSDCWSYDFYEVQPWSGEGKVFEVKLTHHVDLEHISASTTLVVTFSQPLTYGNAEFDYVVSGNTITITRSLLADAYNDGDLVTYKIWAACGDESATSGLTITGVTLSCDKQVNVQGKFD